MFEQAFKNVDDVLWKEAGCTTELDYIEQTSWLLFLKYLDGLEYAKADEAALAGRKYTVILDRRFRWEEWAAPKGKDGQIDHNRARTGDDLRDFVNQKLFPYLHGFKQRATGPATIEYKIGEIFAEIKNKISSGYNLREIIDHIDELRFRSQIEKHELSHLYEAKIRNMGNAGRNGGECYTPRPLIRAMVQVVRPKIGERSYDGACGRRASCVSRSTSWEVLLHFFPLFAAKGWVRPSARARRRSCSSALHQNAQGGRAHYTRVLLQGLSFWVRSTSHGPPENPTGHLEKQATRRRKQPVRPAEF